MIVAVLVLLWNVGQQRTHTLLVDLPYYTFNQEADWASPYLTIEITETGAVLLEGQPIALGNLSQAIKDTGLEFPTVLFSPHGNADYGTSAMALAAIIEAGVATSEVCFDQLERHRTFGKIGYRQHRFPTDAVNEAGLWHQVSDIGPNGCMQFAPPPPV